MANHKNNFGADPDPDPDPDPIIPYHRIISQFLKHNEWESGPAHLKYQWGAGVRLETQHLYQQPQLGRARKSKKDRLLARHNETVYTGARKASEDSGTRPRSAAVCSFVRLHSGPLPWSSVKCQLLCVSWTQTGVWQFPSYAVALLRLYSQSWLSRWVTVPANHKGCQSPPLSVNEWVSRNAQ